MSHLNFSIWAFPPIFVVLKLTCLVTLFDPKLQIFKNSPKLTIFGIFNWLLSTQKRSSLRSQCRMRLFLWFSNTTYLPQLPHYSRICSTNLQFLLRLTNCQLKLIMPMECNLLQNAEFLGEITQPLEPRFVCLTFGKYKCQYHQMF